MTIKKRSEGYINRIVYKSVSQARQDIATWKAAIREATNVDAPKRVRLNRLYNDIMLDAHLVSQIQNRKAQTLQTSFSLYKDGKLDKVHSELLRSASWMPVLISNILDTVYYGASLIEFLTENNTLKVAAIPRTNFVPDNGTLYFDETDTKGIPYRELKEYGTWLIEFGESKDFGLLNKAVPHVLFKRFAQSCWSELCEIYGIPPRVLKTNTQDPGMLSRAESMMRDIGAAAWYIIDETESFEFAKGVDTNGDVYNNLIKLCKDEISLLIMGAIIGQDTKHGNESKETVSIHMFENLINADRRMVEREMNTLVLPALYRIGILPDGLSMRYDPEEDLSMLWNMTRDALPYLDVDPNWIKDKFGIAVTGPASKKGQKNFFQNGPDFVVRAGLNLHAELADLYHIQCDCHPKQDNLASGNNTDPAEVPIFSKKLFAKAIRYLYKKRKYRPEMLQDAPVSALIGETNRILSMPIEDGIMPAEMIRKLRNDVFIFSGCKTYWQLREVSAQLLDEKGNLKPYRKFLEDVKNQGIYDRYNVQYLEAEYIFAESSAQMAAKWAEYKKDAQQYNLQYRTAADERVRESHQVLHNVTRPADDTFWNNYFPPNGWRCRCNVVQVRKGKFPETPPDDALKAGEKATTQINKKGENRAAIFRFNPGKQKIIFPSHHPYRKVQEQVSAIVVTLAAKHANSYQVIKEYRNGGKLSVHNLVNKKRTDYKDVEQAAVYFAREGGKVEITPKIKHYQNPLYENIYGSLKGTPYERKCPDFRVNDLFYEVEGFKGMPSKKKLSAMLSRGLKQSSRIIINDPGVTDRYLQRVIRYRKQQGQIVDEVWLKRGDDIRRVY